MQQRFLSTVSGASRVSGGPTPRTAPAPGLPYTCYHPKYLQGILASNLKGPSLFTAFVYKPVSDCSAELKAPWAIVDIEWLLAAEAQHYGLYVATSSIPATGIGLFR